LISVQAQITVRCLRDQGKSIKQIARDMGLSRNTVRRYLRDRTVADYPSRKARPNAQLEPFAHDVEAMLAKELIGSRILAELRKLGYRGPRRTFYRYLLRHKAISASIPAVERFETGPAKQGQYDWSMYTVPIAGAITRVYLHSFILGFSRYQHLCCSLDVRQPSIFAALEESFVSVGGVPHEMLFDNPRAIVSYPRPSLVFNQHFLEFARFYGFLPRACWPARAQTKGKVERPFQMVEEHFIKGNTYSDWVDFARSLDHFTQTVLNARIHGTTRERPADRLRLEQPLLKQLPATRFISSRECFRKVSLDCLVAYAGSRYSVPWQYASKSVWLRPTLDSKLEILAQTGERLARHELAKEKGQNVIDLAHYSGLREKQASRKHQLSCLFSRHFPEAIAGRFLEKLLAQYRMNAQDQLKRIIAIEQSYPHEVFLWAFEQALQYNTFSYRFLSGLLGQQEPIVAAAPILTERQRNLPALDVKRSLESYQTLLFEHGLKGGTHD
jgi:transposase